jgi:hypothetical protein
VWGEVDVDIVEEVDAQPMLEMFKDSLEHEHER